MQCGDQVYCKQLNRLEEEKEKNKTHQLQQTSSYATVCACCRMFAIEWIKRPPMARTRITHTHTPTPIYGDSYIELASETDHRSSVTSSEKDVLLSVEKASTPNLVYRQGGVESYPSTKRCGQPLSTDWGSGNFYFISVLAPSVRIFRVFFLWFHRKECVCDRWCSVVYLSL